MSESSYIHKVFWNIPGAYIKEAKLRWINIKIIFPLAVYTACMILNVCRYCKVNITTKTSFQYIEIIIRHFLSFFLAFFFFLVKKASAPNKFWKLSVYCISSLLNKFWNEPDPLLLKRIPWVTKQIARYTVQTIALYKVQNDNLGMINSSSYI